MKVSACLARMLAAALLAACGSQQPSAVDNSLIPRSPGAARSHPRESWMLPEAKHHTLLYASVQTSCCASSGANLFAFTFPGGKLVGELNVTSYDMYGICSNAQGDIFVTSYSDDSSDHTIYEYAHAGRKPIATFYDPWNADACAVDPTTGNLAVANWYTNGTYVNANVIVYDLTTGKYTGYHDPQLPYYKWCAYDDKGNLYVDSDGFFSTTGQQKPTFAVLPKGQSTFTNVQVSGTNKFTASSLQWYAGNLVIADVENAIGPETLQTVRIKGSKGYVVGTTILKDYGHKWGDDSQFLIENGHIISGGYPGYYLHEWLFPKGGDPHRLIAQSPPGWWYGIALSPKQGG